MLTQQELRKNLAPFWTTGEVYNEFLTFTRGEDGTASAPLLFRPEHIQSVCSATLETQYEQGRDWVYENGYIVLSKGSTIPCLTQAELYPAQGEQGKSFPRAGGGYILFSEGAVLHRRQVAVTYTARPGQWDGPVPAPQHDALPHTFRKLREDKRLRMVLYGDSISEGANASASTGAPPFLPIWGELVAQLLRMSYGAEVEFFNPSKGGMASDWGADNVHELVTAQRPDLVIIAFGMNDGSGGVSPADFGANIRAMMDDVRAGCPDAEFLLVATTLPNRETLTWDMRPFWGRQEDYAAVLEGMTGPGVAPADMTAIHRALLSRKRFIDMTGNNVNHPNDYLVRWYAQVVGATLGAYEQGGF